MINKDCTYGVLEELAETGKLIMAQLKIRFTRSWSKANPCAPRCFHHVPGRLTCAVAWNCEGWLPAQRSRYMRSLSKNNYVKFTLFEPVEKLAFHKSIIKLRDENLRIRLLWFLFTTSCQNKNRNWVCIFTNQASLWDCQHPWKWSAMGSLVLLLGRCWTH